MELVYTGYVGVPRLEYLLSLNMNDVFLTLFNPSTQILGQ